MASVFNVPIFILAYLGLETIGFQMFSLTCNRIHFFVPNFKILDQREVPRYVLCFDNIESAVSTKLHEF